VTAGLSTSDAERPSQWLCSSAAGKRLSPTTVPAARPRLGLVSTSGIDGRKLVDIQNRLLIKNSQNCQLEYVIEESGDVELDLIDAYWPSDDYDVGRYTWTGRSRASTQHQKTEIQEPARKTTQPDLPQAHHNEVCKLEWENEELYFRRMYIVWQPIFVFVWRSLVCRCILEESSRSKAAPRCDLLILDPCPTHSRERLNPKNAEYFAKHCSRVYTKLEDDREYFQQYGGYDVFRVWVWHVIIENQELGKLIDLRCLMPLEEFEQKYHLLEHVSDDVWDKLLEYEEEIKREVEVMKECSLNRAEEGPYPPDKEFCPNDTRTRTDIYLELLRKEMER